MMTENTKSSNSSIPYNHRDSQHTSRWLFIIPLLIIVFALGFLSANLIPEDRDSAPLTFTNFPHTPTPVPATAEKDNTPIPYAQIDTDLLPTLYIDIAPDDFDLIKAKREQALEKWILIATDGDYVPATIRLGNNNPMTARLRLKGDWADHFSGQKWSYRVQLRDDHTLFGMRVFSIQSPSTRSYLNEWLFLDNLRREDILAVRYSFVNVVENGVDKGVYALEEAFSKELYESLGRREGLMIRYNEDILWRYWAGFENDLSTPRGVMDFYIIDEFQTNKIRNDPVLSQQRLTAIGQLRGYLNGNLASFKVFDTETTAKFLALTDVWGAGHALQWHNLRYYYNPITTKLEPVVFDSQPLEAGTWVELSQLQGIRQTISLNDPHIQRAYVQSLWNYTDPLYLETLQLTYEPIYSQYQIALSNEYSSTLTNRGTSVLNAPWEELEQRQQALRELLNPIQMTYAVIPDGVQSDKLQISVGNLLDFPVEIVSARINNTILPAVSDWISPESSDLFVDNAGDSAPILKPLDLSAEFIPYASLSLPIQNEGVDEASEPVVQLETRIWGLSQSITQPVLSGYPSIYVDAVLPESPELAEVLSIHPFLNVDEPTRMLKVQPGEWEVKQDLVLPDGYGLLVSAGTKLKFAADIVLLAYGPLQLEGTEANPIFFGPIDSEWAGVVVLDAGSSSHWSNTVIDATNTVEREGWILTGGVTFYKSPIFISNCVFQNSLGEDALNIIQSQFSIEETTFHSSSFDAFDGDFTQGNIKNSRFIAIAADGIDISGSDVMIEGIEMLSIGDKGISVGESSRLSGFDIVIKEANFGIVSKDLSHVKISHISLDNIGTAGLAAYIKKPEYGPATMSAQDVHFGRVSPDRFTLVQTGSWIDLEQERIWGSDIDIDMLYNQ